MSSYPHLLAPGRFGSLELPNRIVMPATRTAMAQADGAVSDREIAFLTARARGGAGLLVTGSLVTSTDLEAAPPVTGRADSDGYLPGLTRLAAAVHEADGRIAAQLSPGFGRLAPRRRGTPVSASGTAWAPDRTVSCRALWPTEIELLVARFGEAAGRVAEAGFDAIDVHGRAGYLVDQFLTAAWNNRTDGYGGSVENRARFAVELVAAARAAAPGLPISFRLAVTHRTADGRGVEESIEIANLLEAAGVDVLITDDGSPEASDWTAPPYYLGEAPGLDTAMALRRGVGVPVVAVGSITPEAAEKALAEGSVDFVGMGRALIADPDLPRKLAAGRPGTVRPCVRCNVMCVGHVQAGEPLGCSVNPQAGFEAVRLVQRATRTKRVLVIGGGPAGLEAARVAATRGHVVDLYEKQAQLGGVLWSAATPEFKRDLRELVQWWKGQLAGLPVTVHLNREVTSRSSVLRSADEIIVATGGRMEHPVDITGFERADVVDVLDVHRGAVVGHTVVVAGAGLSGADAALELAIDGHAVTLVEQGPVVARDVLPVNRTALVRRLAETRVKVLTHHVVRSVDDDGVLADGPESRVRIPADTVVTAFGLRPDRSLVGAESLEDPRVHVVGDCIRPGQLGDAVHAGFLVAQLL